MATSLENKLAGKVEQLEAQLAERERTIRTLRERLDERAPRDPADLNPPVIEEGGEEALYSHLIGLLPDAVAICDQAGRLRFINAAGVQMLGGDSASDLLERSFWAFIPDDERALLRERQQRLREGQRVDFFEHHLQPLGGERVPVESASVPIRYEGAPAVLIAVRDVRPRREVERALSASQDLFYDAFHLGPAVLAIMRFSDGVYIDVNERFEQVTGYAREEAVGSSALDLGLWVDPEVRAAALREVQQHGRVLDVEWQLRRKDGSRRVILTSAQRVEMNGEACLVTSSFDITRRRQAQKAERESRTLLHKVFHASPAAIAITRAADGQFIDVNSEMCRLYGFEREELLERTSTEAGLWADPDVRNDVIARIEREGALHDYDLRMRQRSGNPVDVLFSFQRIDVDGEPCILSVGTDITQRKQGEVALREAKEQAEELARLRTGMLTNITHEIRTPLTVILGFTSILRQGVNKKYERFVDLIERSGRRLLLTLDSVLDLAQLEAGTLEVQPVRYNVLNLVRKAATAFQSVAEEKGLTFHLDVPSTGLYASFDYEVLSRALDHVLDNAAKFTKEGAVTVSVRSDEASVYIDVEDTGIGIEESFLGHVFESFTQESTGLNRSYQGSGLGLSVSQKLIERMGGSLSAASEKGEGSVFTIELPRSEPSASEQSAIAASG